MFVVKLFQSCDLTVEVTNGLPIKPRIRVVKNFHRILLAVRPSCKFHLGCKSSPKFSSKDVVIYF